MAAMELEELDARKKEEEGEEEAVGPQLKR